MRLLSALAGLADSVAQTGTAVAAVIADRNFHRAVDSLGANATAQRALAAIWDRLVLAEVHGIWSAPPVTAPHGPLLAAVAAGNDNEAAELAREHVSAGLTRTRAPSF